MHFTSCGKGVLPVYSKGKSFFVVCVGKDARVVGTRLRLVNFRQPG